MRPSYTYESRTHLRVGFTYMNPRFRTATHSQERVQSCPEGEGVGQHGGLAALVHLRAPSEVPELPLHILGSGVLLELERLEEGDGRAEVREVAPRSGSLRTLGVVYEYP